MPNIDIFEIDLPRALRCADYRQEISQKINGFTLSDACEAAAELLEKKQNSKSGRKPKPITIRGQVFSSLKEAAEHFGLSESTIKSAKSNGRLDTVGLGKGYRTDEVKKEVYEKRKKQIHFQGCVFNGWAEARHVTKRSRSYMIAHGAVVK